MHDKSESCFLFSSYNLIIVGIFASCLQFYTKKQNLKLLRIGENDFIRSLLFINMYIQNLW